MNNPQPTHDEIAQKLLNHCYIDRLAAENSSAKYAISVQENQGSGRIYYVVDYMHYNSNTNTSIVLESGEFYYIDDAIAQFLDYKHYDVA